MPASSLLSKSFNPVLVGRTPIGSKKHTCPFTAAAFAAFSTDFAAHCVDIDEWDDVPLEAPTVDAQDTEEDCTSGGKFEPARAEAFNAFCATFWDTYNGKWAEDFPDVSMRASVESVDIDDLSTGTNGSLGLCYMDQDCPPIVTPFDTTTDMFCPTRYIPLKPTNVRLANFVTKVLIAQRQSPLLHGGSRTGVHDVGEMQDTDCDLCLYLGKLYEKPHTGSDGAPFTPRRHDFIRTHPIEQHMSDCAILVHNMSLL